jgi:hypothetical protein
MAPFRWVGRDPEAQLADLLQQHTDREFWLHRHPWVALKCLVLVRRLPALTFRSSESREGKAMERRFKRSRLERFTVIQQLRSVLSLPTDGTPYNQGRARATQRRKARAALRLGVTIGMVTKDSERRELLAMANAFERVNPRPLYRVEEPENDDLLDLEFWMVAQDEGGEAIVLAVIAVDGEFALLRYLRTLTHTDASSAARYLVTEKVADALVARGVRYLVNGVNPFKMPSGLLHFSRMVGFRLVRLRVGRPLS